MARTLYAGRTGDTVVSLFDFGTNRKLLGVPTAGDGSPVSVTLTVWDEPDGTQLTDLRAADGTTPITAVEIPAGDIQIPAFYGPDGVTGDLWLKDPEGDWSRLDIGPVGPAGPTGPTGDFANKFRGAWSSATTYASGDIVTNGGSSWLALAGSTNVTPTDGATWTKVAAKGDTGATGATGPTGATGATGATGPGVAAGGTTGQVLKKNSNADYDTGWTTLGDAAAKNTGTTPGTVAAGDDSRITGAAQKSNNLSDLANPATARANIEAAGSTGGGREKSAALSATTGTCTGDLSAASIFTVTPTGNITLAFSNVPATGTACTVTVIVTQGATVRTVTPPTGTKWMGSAAPTQVASKACAFTFLTVDGGTTWYASAAVEQ